MRESTSRSSVCLEPGTRLDRYELLCVIARGDTSTVWLGRLQGKHGFEKLVAVKTILPEKAADARFQQLLLAEAEVVSQIEDPHVAQLLDLGELNDVLYLVMEYVDGDSLARLQRVAAKSATSVPPEIALRIVMDVCSGLTAAHGLRGASRGVVHGSMSPENVLVTMSGAAKIIGFGLGSSRAHVAGETGAVGADVHFMSPEQALGRPLDPRTDVWSAGTVLYALLAGHSPYGEARPLEAFHALTSRAPVTPLPVSIPGPVRAIVDRARRHHPDDRFASAAEMQAAIETAVSYAGLTASRADVAQFFASTLSDQSELRRKIVERALEEAERRARVHGELMVPVDSEVDGAVSPPRTQWIPPHVETLRPPATSPMDGATSAAPGAWSQPIDSPLEDEQTVVATPEAILDAAAAAIMETPPPAIVAPRPAPGPSVYSGKTLVMRPGAPARAASPWARNTERYASHSEPPPDAGSTPSGVPPQARMGAWALRIGVVVAAVAALALVISRWQSEAPLRGRAQPAPNAPAAREVPPSVPAPFVVAEPSEPDPVISAEAGAHVAAGAAPVPETREQPAAMTAFPPLQGAGAARVPRSGSEAKSEMPMPTSVGVATAANKTRAPATIATTSTTAEPGPGHGAAHTSDSTPPATARTPKRSSIDDGF